MRSLKLTLAYDGTAYAGWQVQVNQPTVQASLEQAIAKVTGASIRTHASGRTDAGVHALGQVVSLETASPLSVDVLQRAINAELPDDIVARSVVEAPHGFHARRDAVKKRYRYQIHDGPTPDVFGRRYVWHLPRRLQHQAMHRAAQGLVGLHDFCSFETRGAERATSVRTVSTICVRRSPVENGDRVMVEVEADGFLYNMVRAIVGTLVQVGRSAKPEHWPTEVLRAKNRKLAGPTAPAHGLFLVEVTYK